MNISNKTKLLALIANPVEHSKSPELHNNWAFQNGIDLAYIPFKVKNLKPFMSWFKSSNFMGANVTIPYKEEIINYLDTISEDAESIGAVNTILREKGKWIGLNTDVYGIEKSLNDSLFNDCKVLLIGAGGAARAVLHTLNKKNIRPFIKNRSLDRIMRLKDSFDFDICPDSIYQEKVDLIINTTPIGMNNNESPIVLSNFNTKIKFVFDLIYNPQKTALLKEAEKLDITFTNGSIMLEEQAKRSFELWTDIYP